MKWISGGVTAPIGFLASGIRCGIKKSSKKKDLALIVSQSPCDAAGAFTTNQVRAACVDVTADHLKDHRAQAIVANSGNANCLTGEAGRENTLKMAKAVAERLHLKPKNILVASTGVIGKQLPIKKIIQSIPVLIDGLSRKGSEHAAAAILTTDRTAKEVAVSIKIGRKNVRLGAIAKGAGMVEPLMMVPRHATMLCFVTTDALITQAALRGALQRAVRRTFNRISIDGDRSTNDMTLLLANGRAENKKIVEKTKEFWTFAYALESMCLSLAKSMIRDAEGATKFVEVVVRNAASKEDAQTAARAVANSSLVKTALFGGDPNWGRIAAAVGASGSTVDQKKLMIYLGRELVLRHGNRVQKPSAVLNRIFKRRNIRLLMDLGVGKYSTVFWTCDLSTSYVRINSAYRT